MELTAGPAAPADLDAVRALVRAEYAARGYCAPDGTVPAHAGLDGRPETVVLVARRGFRLAGTLSLTRVGDSSALAWRFATDPSARGRPDVLGALIDAGFAVLDSWDTEYLAAKVHPDHARAWTRLLGMTQLGHEFPDSGVNGAPAAVLCGDVAVLRDRWTRRKTR